MPLLVNFKYKYLYAMHTSYILPVFIYGCQSIRLYHTCSRCTTHHMHNVCTIISKIIINFNAVNN